MRKLFVFFALMFAIQAHAARDFYTSAPAYYGTGTQLTCPGSSVDPSKCYNDTSAGLCSMLWPGSTPSSPTANTVQCLVDETSSMATITRNINTCGGLVPPQDRKHPIGAGSTCVPRCPFDRDPFTGECIDCESNAWDIATESCIDQDCSADEMQVHDAEYMASGCTGSGCSDGSVSYCHALDEPCENPLGDLEYDPTFEFCQEAKDACDAIGGVYGGIGTDGGNRQVCLKDYGTGSECSSGSMNWVENTDGSFAFGCAATNEPPNSTCDAQLYDCDEDGNVDDQDHDGCVDNGTANEEGCGGTPSGGPGTEPGGEGDGAGNVGEDPLNPPVEGAGDCDPTSQNYAECTGMGGGISDDKTKSITEYGTSLSDAVTAMDAASDETTDGFIDALGDGDAGIAAPSWASGIADAIIPGYGSCSSLSLTWKGHTLSITCSDTAILRQILAWFAYALTVWSIFEIAIIKRGA